MRLEMVPDGRGGLRSAKRIVMRDCLWQDVEVIPMVRPQEGHYLAEVLLRPNMGDGLWPLQKKEPDAAAAACDLEDEMDIVRIALEAVGCGSRLRTAIEEGLRWI